MKSDALPVYTGIAGRKLFCYNRGMKVAEYKKEQQS